MAESVVGQISPDGYHESDWTDPLAPEFIVGLGASAGGLEALERFFQAVPLDTGMAFVVIQHLSPDFNSLMDELLARFTKMPIVRVADPVAPLRDTIYLLQPRKEMVLSSGVLHAYDKPSDERLSMPINAFFRSLARDVGERGIAIVLSGTGTDGSLGLCDVHQAGGLVLAQSAESAKFDGMPRSAVATNQVDLILTPEDMPKALVSYARNPAAPLLSAPSLESPTALAGVPAVIERLREVYGLDFNYYKPATISRRIDRRWTLGHAPSIESYCASILSDPQELDALYKDLLIGVTRFFRDPEAFAILENTVIPQLLDKLPSGEEFRVWVAGCATGEEPYSLAMLLLEAMTERGREPNIKIFASDMHRKSLQIAAEGLYSESSIADLSEERRHRFFEREAGGFRVTAQLRRHILFSPHNVIRDPPFTRIDLVSCRNLLIYLQPAAQVKALASFHFALKLRGFLFLGPSEGVSELQHEFETIDRQWKIFQKSRDSRLPMDLRVDLISPVGQRAARASTPGDLRMSRVYDTILKRYVPSSVLVDARRDVVHVFGDAERFLRVPMGRMSADLVAMTRGDLRMAISSALQAVSKKNERVTLRGVRFDDNGTDVILDVVAEPIPDPVSNNHFVLVSFAVQKPATGIQPGLSPEASYTVDAATRVRIQQLELELMQAKESLQTTVEELETSNEELQASNEEMQASNEELQSTNEELHSVNEELYSVNAEHEQRIKDLNRVSSDLKNLIQATEIGTIFLDEEMKIRFFTPAAAKIFNLILQDLERDIRHITSRVEGDDVFDDIGKVAATRTPIEKKIYTASGDIYLRRVMPYFDVNRTPRGLVLTFVEITALSRAEEQRQKLHSELEQRVEQLNELNKQLTTQRDELDRSERFIRTLTNSLPGMVGYWDKDLRCQFANRHYMEWFGFSSEQMLGKTIQELLGPDLLAANEVYIRGALAGEKQRFERVIRKPSGELGYTDAQYIPHVVQGEVSGFAVLVSDITERRQAEEKVLSLNSKLAQQFAELRGSEERFRLIFENALDAILTVDQDGHICFVNPKVGSMFGYEPQELVGQEIEVLIPNHLRSKHQAHRESYLTHPVPRAMGQAGLLQARRKDGTLFPIEVGLSPLKFRDQTQVMAFISDMTVQKQMESERDDVVRKMTEAQKLESLWVLAGGVAHDFNNLLTGIMASASMLAHDRSLALQSKESVAVILESSQRAAELCQQLLAYSGRTRFVFRTQDVSELVKATAKLAQSSVVSARLELQFDLATDLPPVLMDSTQIRQLIMNLVINAAEAMSPHSGPVLIRTCLVDVTPEIRQAAIVIDPNIGRTCIAIVVADTGSGISEGNLKRIFEPFFTTKFTGRGLGLSAVLGIVRGHHGALTVKSEEGRGTTFTVLLPPSLPVQGQRMDESLRSEPGWRGTGKVLLADDEDSIRYVGQLLLHNLGFEVELAASGQEALDRFRAAPTQYTLVLLDLTMPGLSGVEVFTAIRKLHPEQRVLLMSGFSPEEAHEMMGDDFPNAFLPKPFGVDALISAVRQAVEGLRPPSSDLLSEIHG